MIKSKITGLKIEHGFYGLHINPAYKVANLVMMQDV